MTTYLEPPCDHADYFHETEPCGCQRCGLCDELVEFCGREDCENNLPPGYDQYGDDDEWLG